MNRAYSVLDIRAVSDDDRVIEGIASTPTPDRMGDIVDPMGAEFALPMPLLWQHNSEEPIGFVEFAKPTKAGIPFKARLIDPATVESAELKERLQLAWDSIKARLVRAVSIGFRAIKYAFMDDGGIEFQEWEWLELSVVTIPANADCNINVIRSIDATLRAATGRGQDSDDDRPKRPAPPALREKRTPIRAKEGKVPKTIAEQISAFEATRATKTARMIELMEASAEEGVTLDEAQAEEHDTLAAEVKAIDEHLKRLADAQKLIVAKAVPVRGANAEEGSESRGSSVVLVKGDNLPKGTRFTRYAIALARAKGNLMQAVEIAKGWEDTPEVELVLRAAVAAGTTTDTTWAAPLVPYTQMASEFIELLRPATLLGKFGQNGIPALRRVPFNISMPGQTSGSSVGWVGEGKAKPLGALAFNTTTLRWAKAAGIVVLTDELVRFSNPSAEAVVRQDLIDAMAQFLDQQFIDPDVSAVSNVSPASITNGVTSRAATGTSAAYFRADATAVMNSMISNNISPAGSVWIMSEIQAVKLSMMLNALGQPEFPGISATGGTLLGFPVLTTQNDGIIDGGSPTGNRIILVKASEIFLADDGQVMLDASREASLQMDGAPDEPTSASTVLVSLWQRNMVGLKAERYINWQRRHTGSVQWISDAAYA